MIAPRMWLAAGAVSAVLCLNLAAPDLLLGLVPGCPLRALTGWECPGCGSTRALSALARGDLAGAWRFNPLTVAGAVFVPLGLLLRRWRTTSTARGLDPDPCSRG